MLILVINFDMFKLIYFLLATFFFSPIYGQNIIMSKKLKTNWQKVIPLKISQDTNYLELIKKNKIELICVNNSLEIISSKRIKASYKKSNLRVLTIINIGNANYVFANFWNHLYKKDFLFVRRLNSEGEFVGEWKQIDECEQHIQPSEASFFLKVSQNRKYFAIYSHQYKEIDRGPININVKIYDNEFKFINSFNTSAGEPKSQVFVEQLEIANNGNIFIKIIENKGIVRYGVNYVYKKYYTILSASIGDSILFSNKLQLKNNKIITDAIIKVKNDNSLLIGGFYSKYGFVSAKGVFLMQLNEKSLHIENINDFSEALINKYYLPADYKKRINNEALKFTAQRIEYSLKGEIFIVGELITKYSASKNGIGKGTIYDKDDYDMFLHGAILVKKINGDNKWEQIIPKKQKGYYSSDISFSYLFNDNGFSFIFNTYINDSKNYNAIYKQNKKGKTKLVQMDLNGNIIHEELFKFTTNCNPVIYRPLPFYNKLIFLTKSNRLIYFEL